MVEVTLGRGGTEDILSEVTDSVADSRERARVVAVGVAGGSRGSESLRGGEEGDDNGGGVYIEVD